MRTDGVDISEWQDENGCPVWSEMQNYSFIALRVNDGRSWDGSLRSYWAQLAGMSTRWKILYTLPDPRLGVSQSVDLFAQFCRNAGVPLPFLPGMGVSIDDESTLYHGQFRGQDMRDFKSGIQSVTGRDSLFYTHPLQGNYGFCRDEGWASWFPWPVGHNVGPGDDGIIVPDVHQWGVAGPGEQWGFPRTSVDVDQVNAPAVLDRLCGWSTVPPVDPPLQFGVNDMAMPQVVVEDGTVFALDGPNQRAIPFDSQDKLTQLVALGVVLPPGDDSPGRTYHTNLAVIQARFTITPVWK